MNNIQKIHLMFGEKTKQQLLWLILFSIFLSAIEVIGISAVMPFIDIAVNFNSIHNNQYYQWIYIFFNFESDVNFAISFGLALFLFFLFRGFVNLLHSYTIAHFTQNLYAEITKRLFKAYLSMPYQAFTNKNSSYLSKAIITEASLMAIVIKSILVMLSETLVVIFLYALMVLFSWKITLTFTVILAIKIFFLTKTVSKKIKKSGSIRAEAQKGFYETINRVFGNFKHVKLQDENRLMQVVSNFSEKINKYTEANATHEFLSTIPRIVIETIGFSMIVLLLMVLLYLKQTDVAYILPTLSLFVLALYRLLPSANRIVNGYNSILFYHKSIDIINAELGTVQENLKSDTIEFNSAIELKNVSFSYQNKATLQDIFLIIKKGEKVAVIGESGSGKSTLVDLIIGLHQPSQGEIRIDGLLLNKSNLQNWRSQVGYISQQVYLFDGTIEENVCFGRKVERKLLDKVLKKANIFDFIHTKQGVNTLVGEGGVQLSGGQKQRIAIARALYGQPEILVLDEATSALDNKTEKKIMNEIYQIGKGVTLIIVAHRLSTVERCDKVLEVINGQIIER